VVRTLSDKDTDAATALRSAGLELAVATKANPKALFKRPG